MKKRDDAGNFETEDFKSPGLIHVGAVYSICVCLFFFAGILFREWNFYKANLITQFGLILLTPVLFLVLFKFDVKKVLKLNKVKIKTLIIIFFLVASSIPLVTIFNFLNYFLVKIIFGRVELLRIPMNDSLSGILISFFVISVAAGICEEVLFRGVIQKGIEGYGIKKAIIITALLFGLMHLDFQRLFATFLLGALIGFIDYKTNSLYGGIFAHFLNNFIALMLRLYSLKTDKNLESGGVNADMFSWFHDKPAITQIDIIVELLLIIVVFGTIFGFFMHLFIKSTSEIKFDVEEEKKSVRLMDIIVFVPGLLIVVFAYIIQGISMGGFESSEIIESIHKYTFLIKMF